MNNTFATSNNLREIQWQQPWKYEIAQKLRLILDQYGATPKLQEIIASSRIPSLAEEAQELAKLTWDQLAALRIETMVTNRMTTYETELAALLKRTPLAIESIMTQEWWNAA